MGIEVSRTPRRHCWMVSDASTCRTLVLSLNVRANICMTPQILSSLSCLSFEEQALVDWRKTFVLDWCF